jgi:hypothetical protein
VETVQKAVIDLLAAPNIVATQVLP